MRKFWYSALAAALVLTGCQKEISETPAVGECQTISFIAETSVETKSSMTIDGTTVKYSWTDEDKDFHVFYGESSASPVTSDLSSDGIMSISATFEPGTLPTEGDVAFTGYLNGSVKAVQTMDAENNSYDPKSDVMIAKASVPASTLNEPVLFQFKRMVSVAKLTLSGLPVKADRVVVSSDQSILGSFDQTGNYTAKDGVIEVNGIGGNNVVYFTLAPATDATLSVTAFTSDGVYAGTTNGPKTFKAGNVRGTTVVMTKVTALFKETFDTNEGTGGNDNQWSGNIASGTISSDNTWEFAFGSAANLCAKFGTTKNQGSATTPSINAGTSEFVISFKAAAWLNDKENTSLTLIPSNCTLDQTSVTLEKGQWTTYMVHASNVTGPIKIQFLAGVEANNRFFLDEVIVYNNEAYVDARTKLATPEGVKASIDDTTPNKINISWNAVTNASQYEIVLSSDEKGEIVKSSTDTNVSAEGLDYQTEYSIKVRAVTNDDINYISSEYSNAVTATTGAKPAGVKEWVKTSFANLKSGDQVVIVRTSGSSVALSNNNGTTSAPTAEPISVNNDKLSSTPEDNVIWFVGVEGESRVFYADKNSNTWLYCTSSNNGVRVGTNSAKTFSFDDGYLKHVGTSRYVGVYNNADWRCYTTNTQTNIANQIFEFFVMSGSSENGTDPTPGTDPNDSGDDSDAIGKFIFNTDAGLTSLGITKPEAGKGTNISTSLTNGDVTVSFTSGGTATRVWNSQGLTDLRVYSGGGSITVSSSKTITKIEFSGSKATDMVADNGELNGNEWTGESKTVVFTASSNLNISSIVVW